MRRRRFSLLFLVYVVIGVVVAVNRGYITQRLLLDVLEALLVILLWPLALLGVLDLSL